MFSRYAGTNLINIRKDSGLKVYKIAEFLNISRVQYNNLEKQRCRLSKDKADLLSELFKVPVEEIFNDAKL